MISRVLFLLLILPQFLFAKDLIIRGRVLNSDSTAIAPAEVIIPGLSRTVTNNDGHFVFKLTEAAAEKHFLKSGSDWFIEVIKGDFLLMEPADGRITIKHNYDYQMPHKLYMARKGSLALLRSDRVLEHVFKKRLDAAISAKDKTFARQLEIAQQAARLGLSEEKLAAAVDVYKESLRTSADLFKKGLVALDDANSANESTERQSKLNKAKENFRESIGKDETDSRKGREADERLPESYYQLGNTFFSEARYDSAQVYLLKAVATKPGLPEMLNRLGQIQYELALYEEALQNYNHALKIDMEAAQPDSAGIAILLNNIGEVYRKQGNMPQPSPSMSRLCRLTWTILARVIRKWPLV